MSVAHLYLALPFSFCTCSIDHIPSILLSCKEEEASFPLFFFVCVFVRWRWSRFSIPFFFCLYVVALCCLCCFPCQLSFSWMYDICFFFLLLLLISISPSCVCMIFVLSCNVGGGRFIYFCFSCFFFFMFCLLLSICTLFMNVQRCTLSLFFFPLLDTAAPVSPFSQTYIIPLQRRCGSLSLLLFCLKEKMKSEAITTKIKSVNSDCAGCQLQ